jgi:hypothetical protein
MKSFVRLCKDGLKWLWEMFWDYFLMGRYVRANCGHLTREIETVRVDGIFRTIKLSHNMDNSIEWCHKCVVRQCRKCFWCGTTIVPGDAIVIYKPTEENPISDQAWRWRSEPLLFAGCSDPECPAKSKYSLFAEIWWKLPSVNAPYKIN